MNAGGGLGFLVTAGPTREPIDAVRFLSNRSSGRMGYAVAGAALERGHDVVLISGPTALDPPPGAVVVSVETAAEMAGAVEERFPHCDCLVMAAAVADYQVAHPVEGKMKKGPGDLTLRLIRTTDILARAGLQKKSQTLVGFAVESKDLLQNARRKLSAKNLDLIVANGVGAFAVSESSVVFLTQTRDELSFTDMPKLDIARAIIQWVEDFRNR
jgi:phosphopantothenoylcysteine decarboxylase/phosphopantothenate--cysteine ligase